MSYPTHPYSWPHSLPGANVRTAYQVPMSATAHLFTELPQQNRKNFHFQMMELSTSLHVDLQAPKKVLNHL
jgi:hypothetical protein